MMKKAKNIAGITRKVMAIVREVKGRCAAGFKVSDRIIFEGANISLDQSDRVCAYALANIMPTVFAVRLGVDFEKLGFKGRLWQCVDPGPPYTEGGTVLFEVITCKDEVE